MEAQDQWYIKLISAILAVLILGVGCFWLGNRLLKSRHKSSSSVGSSSSSAGSLQIGSGSMIFDIARKAG